jgi:hypothetical protein
MFDIDHSAGEPGPQGYKSLQLKGHFGDVERASAQSNVNPV